MHPKYRLLRLLRRRWTALGCLLAYLSVSTPFLTVTAAIAAWLDNDHLISFQADGTGTSIVLGHTASQPRTRTAHTHVHRAVSNTLVWLSNVESCPDADHYIKFPSSDTACVIYGWSLVSGRSALPLISDWTVVPQGHPINLPLAASVQQRLHRPPGSVGGRHSTVLLI